MDAKDIATEIEMKKHAYRQTQDGIVISFVCHPNDVTPDIATAALGTRYKVFLVEVGDDEQPVAKAAPAASEKPRERFADKMLSVQAGIRCNDERFWRFLGYKGYACKSDPVAQSADIVRALCSVESRSSLDTIGSAGSAWMSLNDEFEQWAGQVAEAR